MYKRLLSEAIGTYFLIFAAGVSDGEPFAVGGTLLCLMVFTGFVSKAIFNPAMTISFILKAYTDKKLTEEYLLELILYIVIQFVFGLLGALTAWGILGHSIHFSKLDGYNDAETFFGEVVYTSMIASNAHIMEVLSDNPVIKGTIVAMTVTAGIWAIGKISGACFNPAVGFSINLVNYIKAQKGMGDTWIYILGPVLGAVIGTFISDFFSKHLQEMRRLNEVPKEEEEITITLGD
jgi:glycerol uptake facilitator-like aquaporin